jgi:hypothetical protein
MDDQRGQRGRLNKNPENLLDVAGVTALGLAPPEAIGYQKGLGSSVGRAED